MSQPTLNAADVTVIDSADSTTNWSQTGQMGPILDTDVFLQGTSAIGIEFKSAVASEMRYNRGSGSTIVGKHIRMWVLFASRGSVDTLANQGVTLRVWGTNGTDWGEWDLGGNDSGEWIGDGWKMVVQDGDVAFDRNSGTAPAKTAIQYIGLGIQVINTLSKSSGCLIDQLMISATADTTDVTGGVLEITSPSHTGASDLDFNDNGAGADTIVRPSGSFLTDGFESGDVIKVTGTTSNNGDLTVVTAAALTLTLATGVLVDEQNTSGTVTAVVPLQDIVDQDRLTDDTWYGHISKDSGDGSFVLTGKLVFGDASGALNTVIRDTDKVMVWSDNAVSTSQYQIAIVEDTGTTEVTFGTEVGTGDDSRGVGGGFMTKFEDRNTFDYSIKATDASPIFNAFGMTINGATGGLDLAQTDVQFVSSVISNSGQIILSTGAEMREGSIVGSTEASGVGAILLNANPTDPEFRDMQLINNVHAIESETNGPTTLDLRNITYSGNTADVRFNHTSGLLTVNVLEGGDTPTTSDGGGGGTIDVQNPVTTLVNIKDNLGVNLQNATVYLRATDGTGDLPFQDSVTITRSGTVATVTHTTHGLETGDKVKIEGITDKTEDNAGVHTITVTTVNAYTYVTTDSGSTSYTGTIISTGVMISGLTDASGNISKAKTLTLDQPLTGFARKSTATPRFKSFSLNGTTDNADGLTINIRLILDE